MPFTPVPVNVAYPMVRKKQPLSTKKVNFKLEADSKQVTQFRIDVFEVSVADFIKVSRIGNDSALMIGDFPEGKTGSVRLFARSQPLDQLKTIVSKNPYLAVLSLAKGKSADTGTTQFKAVTSYAFDTLEEIPLMIKRLLKRYTENKAPPDSQKTKLYKWEGSFLTQWERKDDGYKSISYAKLSTLANRVIEHFKLPRDRIHVVNSKTRSARILGVAQMSYDDASSAVPVFVVVNIHDSTADTLIHELAHTVVAFTAGKRCAHHGAEFTGVYAHLLGMFSVFEEKAVIASMQKAGLRVTPYIGATKVVSTDLA